jgi:ABC-type multidrug transport system ATPase subunit
MTMSEGSPAVVLTAQDLNVAIRARPADLQRILNKIQGRGQAASVQKKQTILRDVTIKIPGPSLTAIIGPSGCGKTTLLDALSGRRRNDALLEYSGRTSIVGDGHNYATTRSGSASGLDVAYARQEDNLFPMLTVRETLEYAATLNSHQSQRSERGDAVGDVIHSLGLDRCADSRIGDPQHKGCSGGEIRRTSIGIQILKRQPILFLDEPTTGLDSKAALDLLHVLRRLVDNGTTVVVTLHQPRSEAWAEIENLVVMSQGTVLYAGNSQHSLGHFAKGGWSVNAFDNPFDFISDLIAVDTRSESAEETSRARVMGLRELWISTPLVDNHMHFRQSLAISPCPGYDRQEGNRFWKLLLTHCHRTLRMTLRDRLGVVASLLEGLCMGLACGLIFYQLDGDLPGIRSRQGALYCTSSMQSYLVLLYETYRLTADLPAYDRELEDGVVTPATFYLSRRLTRFAIEDITTPLIFSIAFYFMAGLRAGASEFFLYYLVQLLLHLISVNVATCCAATTRGFIRAGLLANLNYVVQCLCAGLFINPGSLAPWVGWIRWGTHLVSALPMTTMSCA